MRKNPQQELDVAKRILLDLQIKKELLIKSNNLAYFVPNPGGQTNFFEECHRYVRAVFSGNRFGKSTAGVVEDVSWLIGERLFYPKDHPLRYKDIPKHGVKGYLVVANWDKSKEIFTKEGDPAVDDSVGKLFKYLPTNSWKITGRNQGYVKEITVTASPYGIPRISTLYIVTTNAWKKDFLTVESGDIDFVHIDEPTEEDLWNGLARGLVDRGGKAWWLMTPKSQPWMYYHIEDRIKVGNEDYWMYTGHQDENLTLDKESKRRFADGLNEKALETAVKGVPSFKSNLVIYTFDERLHTSTQIPKGWKDRLSPPKSWNVGVAIDTHPQTPHAVLMVAISPTGDVIAFNELFEKWPIKEIADWLKSQKCFSQCEYFLMEPAGFKAPENITKLSFADQFYDEDLEPLPGSKKRTDIITKMCDRFGQTEHSTIILNSCPVFTREIQRWAFDKDDKPIDKNDHMIENFGRLLYFNDFTYIEPQQNIQLTTSSDWGFMNVDITKERTGYEYL